MPATGRGQPPRVCVSSAAATTSPASTREWTSTCSRRTAKVSLVHRWKRLRWACPSWRPTFAAAGRSSITVSPVCSCPPATPPRSQWRSPRSPRIPTGAGGSGLPAGPRRPPRLRRTPLHCHHARHLPRVLLARGHPGAGHSVVTEQRAPEGSTLRFANLEDVDADRGVAREPHLRRASRDARSGLPAPACTGASFCRTARFCSSPTTLEPCVRVHRRGREHHGRSIANSCCATAARRASRPRRRDLARAPRRYWRRCATACARRCAGGHGRRRRSSRPRSRPTAAGRGIGTALGSAPRSPSSRRRGVRIGTRRHRGRQRGRGSRLRGRRFRAAAVETSCTGV